MRKRKERREKEKEETCLVRGGNSPERFPPTSLFKAIEG